MAALRMVLERQAKRPREVKRFPGVCRHRLSCSKNQSHAIQSHMPEVADTCRCLKV